MIPLKKVVGMSKICRTTTLDDTYSMCMGIIIHCYTEGHYFLITTLVPELSP